MNRFNSFDGRPARFLKPGRSENFNRWLERQTLRLVKAAVFIAMGYAWAMLAMGKGVVH